MLIDNSAVNLDVNVLLFKKRNTYLLYFFVKLSLIKKTCNIKALQVSGFGLVSLFLEWL
jgi:hypothetical protein